MHRPRPPWSLVPCPPWARAAVLLLVVAASAGLCAQVDELPVAYGPPQFGEQPHIVGTLVFWQRYGARNTIQCKDISRSDNPILEVAEYPANLGGVVVSTSHVFRFRGDGTAAIVATPMESVLLGVPTTFALGNTGVPRAATEDHLFFAGLYEERLSFLAKPTSALEDPSPDAVRHVTYLKYDRTGGTKSRLQAASNRYFVWQDRDPSVESDSWKIYAKRTEDLFVEGAERMVLDTNLYLQASSLGASLDIHDHLLIVQAERRNHPDARADIYLVDLDNARLPIVLASTDEPRVALDWPAISEHYAVWTEFHGFSERRAFAQRLVNGLPYGEAFQISSGTANGSWITIDRNIAVWLGSTIEIGPDGTELERTGVIAAELPLPGATDAGDADANGRLDLTDALVVLNYLFRGGFRPRLRLADADGSGRLDIADAIVLLEHLFRGGRPPGPKP